ncbi:protein PHYLLO, chloroplastic isoform X4 [Beta vulgaris subsp. vulgaris]|uniref:protein PHYLLO, chloroplastic isoform X4 n=2 Tax=Beta vulgaris subsp. vulgaris TaxID=3555 RepID=UPI00203747F6|nr:protein PHYLLO, chloroplastic isoform X4 [Beta vulgaris subsp. vulgaris]
MNTRIIPPNCLSSPSPIFKFHKPKPNLSPKLPSSSTNFHFFRSLLLHQNTILNFLQVNRAIHLNNSFNAMEDEHSGDDLVIEASLTRILPPALTLEHGLVALKDALHEFKLNPPSSTSGFIRFQVAVPPSVNALDCFCCQPDSSEVFPQFYMSKHFENLTHESAFFSKTHGVFGIGAAISFIQSPSSSDEWNSFRRYLLVDSLNITAYGFIDINYDMKSSLMKHDPGSLYFIIPQVINHLPAMQETCCANFMHSTVQKFGIVEDENLEMVYTNAQALGGYNSAASIVEMVSPSSCGPSSCQFSIRLSEKTAVSKNMLDDSIVTSSILQDCANINSVWASLIVEECSRLGLTYFCIAPGSRSSPLAVAASTHPHITCIACYDERSLAFHAIGYARGSQIPAVVITTSGTAVSNLFPAVVEASQDFVPLVLLTADRPSELHAAGANQAIDQVNHFGSYVRFFFNLPAPTDHIPARMVLTTVDSAVHWATCSPCGPVHVNCPFREPLENSPQIWMRSCLDKLNIWISSSQPFTKYIKVQPSNAYNPTYGLTAEVEKVIKNSKRGLLVIGAIHKEDEMWAALVLARHLSWPVVADILSGLRLRKLLTSYREYEENFVFLDHFDHVLLCDTAWQWVELDAIVQVGSKITSKRISRFLEHCFPCSYIMVDRHPCRHDPSHIVTHRIQSTISQFAGCLLKVIFPSRNSEWCRFLQVVNSVVAWELSFQICSEYSLTEPHVAHTLSEVVTSDTALFIGNSMAIRDADMYSQGVLNCIGKSSQLALPCRSIHIVGNRGASGIDGLLSTAVGFSVGCKKRVLCIMGDVSFLHDTNGLSILSFRMRREPITILVINNHGGGIFSFLPIAEKTEAEILEKYFYCNHSISVNKLCAAHGVKHLLAETKLELHEALKTSKKSDTDCVIEVSGSINSNAVFHSVLRNCAAQAASHAFTTLMQLSPPEAAQRDFFYKISKVEYSFYGVNLAAPPTSVSRDVSPSNFVREGFVLALTLDDGSTGFGEIAPLEIHEENLQDVEEQLRFLVHALKGATISYHLPLLRESFSVWMWRVIGVLPGSIFPSVRCGLEMATLNAIAARQDSTLFGILWPQPHQGKVVDQPAANIDICALVDSEGSPSEVADNVLGLVEEGFRAVKVKVARRADPGEDAAVIKEIRRKVGAEVELRVDANRKWTYEEAIKFGSLVKDCGLQYIEEPVQCEDDIVRFCQETGLPIALDETIDKIQGNVPDSLARFTHPGIVALVLKPSVLGGFENAAEIAWWANNKGKLAVVSSTFETSLGLSSYVQFACYLETRSAELSRALDKKPEKCVAHGLGTYKWLAEDITLDTLVICRQPKGRYLGASVDNADRVLHNFRMNCNAISQRSIEENVSIYQLVVEVADISYVIKVQEMGESKDNNALLFLHGFLGTSEDWIPIMKGLSGYAKCFSVDLPGHGKSKMQSSDSYRTTGGQSLSIEVVAAVLSQLINKICTRKVTIIGYSMGARIALYMALRFSGKIDGAVVISGSPGLKNETERRIRAAKDDSRARSLISFGLVPFLDNWYHSDLWMSFREHPKFKKIAASRLEHDDIHGLAKSLSDLSVGRQPPLWEDLKYCKIPLMFVVGEKDAKFKNISQDICREMGQATNHETVEVPNSGHAVHLENPLAIIRLVRQFLTKQSF